MAVRAVDLDIEQADEAWVLGMFEMAGVHEGDAQSLRRRLQHQPARVEKVDRLGFDVGQPRRLAPGGEGVGHFAVEQRGHAVHLFGAEQGIGALDQPLRADDIDFVEIQPLGIERRVDVAAQRDHCVQPVAQPGDAMPGGIDVEMQFGMRGAQQPHMREQPLRRIERQHAEPQPQHLLSAGHRLHRVGQLVEQRRDLLHQ